MSDSKPTGSSGSTPGATPKAGSATDPKPVPPTPGSSSSAPPAGSKPVAPTPGTSTSAPPVGGSSAPKPVAPTPGSSASAPPTVGSSGSKPVPSTSGSPSPANSPTPGTGSCGSAASGSSCPKPPAATSAPPGPSSSCPSGAGSAGAHPVVGSGPPASSSTPPPSPGPATSSKGGPNDIDLIGTSPTGLSSSAPPAGSSSQGTAPIPTLDLASNAPTSSPMPNAPFPPPFGPALGASGGRPSYARSGSMFRSAPSRYGSAVRPPLFYQQMTPPPTPNTGSGSRPPGPYGQMYTGPASPSPMEGPYGPGGRSKSGESRGPRQIPSVPPGFQDNYGFGSHSRESRGLRQTSSCPPSFGPPGFQGNYGPRGGSQSGESRGPRQPFAEAGSFGAPGSGGARPNTALGPFAFLSGPINWQDHPLAVNFASLLRSYLNRNGYRDGVRDPNYGTRQSYGSTGRWNSAGSRGVSSGYPQGSTPPPPAYPPPDY